MIYFLIAIVALTGLFIWASEILAFVVAIWAAVTGWALLSWIHAHPWLAVMYAAGYFLAGAGWSVVKWWFKETEKVRDLKERYNKTKREITWQEFSKGAKTQPADYKTDIMFWIGFWPFSAVWTLIDDPLTRLCRRIYYELQAVYQRITDRVWQ